MQNVTISDWKAVNSGKLRGFCTATLPSGLVFHEVGIFAKDDGSLTASPPARQQIGRDGVPMRDANGKAKYQRIIEFTDGNAAKAWSRAVIDALLLAYPDALPTD